MRVDCSRSCLRSPNYTGPGARTCVRLPNFNYLLYKSYLMLRFGPVDTLPSSPALCQRADQQYRRQASQAQIGSGFNSLGASSSLQVNQILHRVVDTTLQHRLVKGGACELVGKMNIGMSSLAQRQQACTSIVSG